MAWLSLRTTFLATCLACAPVLAQEMEIYVSDVGNNRNGPYQFLRFDGDGGNPQVFATENVSRPQDIIFLEDQGVALISNFGTNRIDRYDLETGDFISAFATNAIQPTRMRIGDDGLLYVLQWAGDGLVRRYQLDGTPVSDFTTVGVQNAIGMDWDADGNFYVASFNLGHVRQFDSAGNDLGVFASTNLVGPTNIYFDDQGDLIVLDWSGNAVRRFDGNGNFLSNFILGVGNPEGVDFLPNGNILIGDGVAGNVPMFGPDGAFIRNYINRGAAGLMLPNAVVIRQLPEGSDFQINPGLNDAWFNPETAGQGFLIVVYPDIQQLFVAWFTFDVERPMADTAMLGGSGQRWLTAQGPYSGNTAELVVSVTTGGVFDQRDPVPTTDSAGSLRIDFEDCATGTVAYDIPSVGLAGEIPIQRVAEDNIPLCEGLGGKRASATPGRR